MGYASDALKGIDMPHTFQEIVKYLPANSVAGSCMVDDGIRYIYYMISATLFYRYDTWTNQHQQLANPTGAFGAGTCMKYTKQIGSQLNGVVYGSVYAMITTGVSTPVFTRYNIASDTWVVQNVTGFPGTFGTDAYICFPSPELNNNSGAYHSGVTQTITSPGGAGAGAVSVLVSALPTALAANTILNFGTMANPIYAVLSAGAAAAATSISVFALPVAIPVSASAPWYDHMYITGNANVFMYRWTISTSVWSATSANAGNPALSYIPVALGAGVALKWLPGIEDLVGGTGYKDRLILIRGAETNSIYYYNLIANTWTALTYTPKVEVFGTGTMVTVLTDVNNKPNRLLIAGSALTQGKNVRILELDIIKGRMDMVSSIDVIPTSTLIVGNRLSNLTTPDGLQQLWIVLHNSSILVKDSSPILLT